MEHMGNDSCLLSWQVCFCVCAVQEQRDMLQLERLQCEELQKKLKKTQVRKTGQALDYLDLIRWLIPTWSIPTWLIPTWLIPTWFNQIYQDWFIPTWYPKVNQFSMVDWSFQLDGWIKPWLPGSCLRKIAPETSAIPKPNKRLYQYLPILSFFQGLLYVKPRWCALSETNSKRTTHLPVAPSQKETIVFQRSIFRCKIAVSFRD